MKRTKLVLLRRDKTLAEVAAQLGTTRQMLGAVERGARTPSLTLAKRIADYYGMTVDELFFPEPVEPIETIEASGEHSPNPV